LILILFGVEAWMSGGWVDVARVVLLILAVFVCVVLHEFGHILQVRRYGIPVKDMVLLPIGVMALAERVPEDPRQEIAVAISGPLVNFALAAILYVVIQVSGRPMAPDTDFLSSLFVINLILGMFNLIPAYPMDGGRILRGLLAMKFPYLRATRYASNVGQLLALAFVVVGFADNTFILLPMIAVIIYYAARSEEQAIRVRAALKGKRAGDFVSRHESSLLLTDPVEHAAAVFERGSPPVLGVTDELRETGGMVNANDVEDAMRRGGCNDPLSTIASFDYPVISADMPAVRAYYFLKAEHQRAAGVVDHGSLAGLLHFDSLLDETR
jgi:stage IV sporulation protein FB